MKLVKMKFVEMQAVLKAVRLNLDIFHSTQGEGNIVGVEGFTPEQLELFDDFLNKEYYLLTK